MEGCNEEPRVCHEVSRMLYAAYLPARLLPFEFSCQSYLNYRKSGSANTYDVVRTSGIVLDVLAVYLTLHYSRQCYLHCV